MVQQCYDVTCRVINVEGELCMMSAIKKAQVLCLEALVEPTARMFEGTSKIVIDIWIWAWPESNMVINLVCNTFTSS
jgi:hypothetical protein